MADASPPSEPKTLATIDILVVDDNMPMRALLRSLLRSIGAQRVREAQSGDEALEMLAIFPADLIVLDYAMPGKTGLDVVRALRADPSHPAHRARILMVTGFGERRHVTAARDAGVDEFLVKPITTQTLMQRVEAVLTKGRDFVANDSFAGPDRRRRAASGAPEGGERRGRAD